MLEVFWRASLTTTGSGYGSDMRFLVLTAIIAAVSTSQLSGHQQTGWQQSPWQVGKQYRYDVQSHTLARLHAGASSGAAFRAHFIVRVRGPGQLEAKLENPQHAQVHQQLDKNRELPQDLKYQPVQDLDKPFEITVEGGRVLSLTLPSTLPLQHENLLKGLIGALQVDLSTHRNIHGSQDSFDKDAQQGLFRKMEADVTGDCETLYAVSPVAAEWRRELPKFASDEDPIEITKSKNYGHCHHKVEYHFGVPDGAEWTGTTHKNNEEQVIRRAAVSRILAGKQGQIYKAETTSTVHVHPHLYGKQKAEVYSHVQLILESVEEDSQPQWQKPEGSRLIKTLLYSMSAKQQAYHDKSSSSESSESHEHLLSQNQISRVRRSNPKFGPVVSKTIKINKRYEQSRSGSSSSSDSDSAYVNDEIPNINEPAYAALYMSPQPHSDKKQNTMNAQKILQDIAQQLQNPNNMPKADFLSKFNILVRVIASMSTEQLAQTSRSIEVGKSSNNIVKSDMWMIYRDAVAQAGTLPAFQQIKTWIQTQKLQGEEAAQVVTTLANTLRYPTKDVMSQFYKLAVSEEVKQQKFLNTAALIAATRFINQGQVNNYTAHSLYPSHMYGRLARKHDSFVVDEILPELSQSLKNAVQQGDSGKAQVYIKAIGNLGHREILKVFAPYLEGQIPTTTYLRVQMVGNLRVLAQQRDRQTRAVLYSILRNAAEPYEVRVIAINTIFFAHPNGAMMQAMAQMTRDDPSVQVRAFLKSAIESAAELKSPRNLDLARTAQAAKWIVTKEKFGNQYSLKSLKDNFDNEYEQDVLRSLSFIGSEDSIFPKLYRYSLRNKNDGWKNENMVLGSFSSIQQFANYLKSMTFSTLDKSNADHKYSAEKVSEMLNIKRDPQEPLEATLYFDIMNQQRLFTFSEEDLKQLPEDIKNYMSEVSKGVDKHYTKVLNQAQVSIMFPVAMGMPFIYKYKEPTVIHIQSKAKGEIKFLPKELAFQAHMDKEIQFTYARNIDGHVGFMDTLTNQYSRVGVINKLQLNIPVKVNIQVQPKQVQFKMQPLRPEQDTTLVHYSVWPYSASQKKESLVPIAQDPTTKVIEGNPRKIYSTDARYGQKIGVLFQLQGYSYSNDFKNFWTMFPASDILTNVVDLLKQRDVALTHFNLKHLAKASPNKGITFNAVYDQLHNQKQGGEMGEPSEMSDVTPNSQTRREELVKRAAAGINNARVMVTDLSAVLEGPQKVEYIITAALGQSDVDRKIQYVAYAGINNPQGKNQYNFVGTVNKPEITRLNFLQALQKDLKSTFNFDIKYGKGGNSRIQIQGDAQRSQKYTEELQNMPSGKQCSQEISENNYYQYACHKMLILAHTPDTFVATFNYKGVDQQAKNATYRVYQILKNLGFWNSDENPLRVNPEGKIEVQVKADYLKGNYMSWSMTSKYGHIEMNNVQIPKWTVGAVSFYNPFKAFERVQNYNTHQQYRPFCSVDGSKIRTFSDRSYDYTLSPAWHVVMQDQASERRNWHDIVVLARRPSQNQQEIYISYKSETGKDMEIDIKPSQSSQQNNVQVKTNGQKVSDGDLTMYWDDVANNNLVSYYTQADGVLVLTIGENRLRVLYDGQRVVLMTGENSHRGSAWGICGRMSGEPRDDYQTPYGLVDKPEYYGASYALDSENADPQTQQLQNQAKQQAYQPKNKYTTILRSDVEWANNMQSSEESWGSQIVYRSRSYLKSKGPCELQQQVQYYENHGEICISTLPVSACQSHCNGQSFQVQPVQVTCKPKLDQQYQTYRNQIQQGQNPQVSGVPQLQQFKVPTACAA